MRSELVSNTRFLTAVLLAIAVPAGLATAAASESIPVPRERPEHADLPVPAEKPATADAAEPQDDTPLPRSRPGDVQAETGVHPDDGPPLPAEKPSAQPVADDGTAETVAGEAVKPDVPPDALHGDAASEDTASEDTASEDAASDDAGDPAPRAPLFAEDAISPACVAIEEGRVSGRPLKPIDDPAGCVVPAVYAVSSVGTERAVQLSPEAELNCAMTARLDQFVEEVVEPAATQILGTELVALGIAGSYVCRPRNGEPDAKPSEHGKANAIDIASFSFADGRIVTVLGDWPATPEPAEPEPQPEAEPEPEPTDAAPDEAETEAAAEPQGEGKDGAGADAETTADAESGDSDAVRFLRAVHAKACGPFTTVIGPDGDEYHRDHFHLDLQPRGAGGQTTFCQ